MAWWRKAKQAEKDADAILKILKQQREALAQALKEATESRSKPEERDADHS